MTAERQRLMERPQRRFRRHGRSGAELLRPRRRRAAQQAAGDDAAHRRDQQSNLIFASPTCFMPATATCIRIFLFDMRAPGELDRVIEAGAATLRACIELGGSITGEHGVGLEKKAYIGLLFNEADLEAMARVRRVFDPDRRFNPAKLFPTPASCGEVRLQPAQYPGGVVDLKNCLRFRVSGLGSSRFLSRRSTLDPRL